MSLPKTVPASWIQKCKVGDSIVCQGHTSYSRTPLQRAGFKFTTNKAWLVLISTEPPIPATILTITELPEEPTWTSNI